MKITDNKKLVQFLEAQKVATVAVSIDDKGTIHAASLVFWNSIDPFCFFFITSRESEKFALLDDEKAIPCAVVVGTEKGTEFSLRMRGRIQEVDQIDYVRQLEAYYQKRGNQHEDISDPTNALLCFTPTWARYTDYSKGYDRRLIDLS